MDFAVRLLVDEFDRLLEGGGRNPHQAGIGQAEFEDEEDRKTSKAKLAVKNIATRRPSSANATKACRLPAVALYVIVHQTGN